MAALIHKTLNANEPAPNLMDYRAMRATFSWDIACTERAGLPHGGLNIAFEAVDRWVASGQGEVAALRWLGKNGERRDISYTELARLSNRFAHSLEQLGIGPGDRVCVLAGRIPE
ncbi:MAG TPA: acetate--CoA ligase, partial [Gammaproteobacteria bacterium]|nr:acetate--CoA ligase [Gammaproteobacteria bacterium]